MAFHAFMSLCFYFCVCRFLLQNIFLKLINIFAFFVFFVFILIDALVFSFSSSIPTEKSQKIFLLSRKIFCEYAPAWTSAKFYCGNKTVNPERAVSLHLALSGSQSDPRIRCILPARGACHIINIYITYILYIPRGFLPRCFHSWKMYSGRGTKAGWAIWVCAVSKGVVF